MNEDRLTPDGFFLMAVTHPSIIVIIGGIGSGKTGLSMKFIDILHDKYKNQKTYIIGSHKMKKILPKWIGIITPGRYRIPNDSIVLGDDMHLHTDSREHWGEPAKILRELERASRQKNMTFIYTTQMTDVLLKSSIGICSMLCIKKPSPFQRDFERPQLRKIIKAVEKEYKIIPVKLDPRKYVYCITNLGEYMVGPYDLPEWWSEELSNLYRDARFGSHMDRIRQIEAM